MLFFKAFVENIALILIFTSFAGIIMPTGKYRSYVKLIMGLSLILAVISPMADIFGSGLTFEDLYAKADSQINMNLINIDKSSYEQELINTIIEDYKKGLTTQISNDLKNLGYSLLKAEIEIDTADESFGAITELSLNITKSSYDSQKLIRVDKISIEAIEAHKAKKDLGESKEIKDLKIFLSGFYNLSEDNIYITITDSN